MTDNPADGPKISGDRVTLVEEWRVEDGGGDKQCVDGWIVFCVGCYRRHGPPKPDFVILHVELGSCA